MPLVTVTMTHSLLLVMLVLILVTHTRAGITRTGLVVIREEAGDIRVRRAVGPVMGADMENDIGGQQQRKYRRLEHSIMVQADIRSRSVGDIILRIEGKMIGIG